MVKRFVSAFPADCSACLHKLNRLQAISFEVDTDDRGRSLQVLVPNL